MGKGSLVLEDSAKVLIYEVIEDEGKGFRSLARHMLLADCVESIEERIEPVADISSLTLLVDWDHVIDAERMVGRHWTRTSLAR